MPVVDTFPALLRDDLETAFEQDIDHVFDVAQVRRSLQQQKSELELELRRVRALMFHLHHWIFKLTNFILSSNFQEYSKLLNSSSWSWSCDAPRL